MPASRRHFGSLQQCWLHSVTGEFFGLHGAHLGVNSCMKDVARRTLYCDSSLAVVTSHQGQQQLMMVMITLGIPHSFMYSSDHDCALSAERNGNSLECVYL